MDRFLDTTAGRLRVAIHGSGPALLLWPSLFLDSAMYRSQVQALADRHTVVTVDNPGHGGSASPPSEFTIGDCAVACVEILQQLRIARATFIGTSWGGLVGIKLAAVRPDLVEGLILVGTSVLRPALLQRMAGRCLALGFRWFGDRAPMRSRIIARLFSSGFVQNHAEVVDQVTATLRDPDRPGVTRAIRTVMVNRRSLLPTLENVTCRTLVVAGALDGIVSSIEARACAASLPDGRFVELPQCGHLPPVEQPALFNEHVRRFLALGTDIPPFGKEVLHA